MNYLITLIHQYPVTSLIAGMYLLSAAVDALPSPGSGKPFKTLSYEWFYSFIHTATNQASKLVANRYPTQSAKLGLVSSHTETEISTQTTEVAKVASVNPTEEKK